jgi:hypothetical protein
MLGICVSMGCSTRNQSVLMIQEGVVLFWVKHLQKCARGVPVDTTSDLVHLINKNERILCTDPLESLNDFTRKGTYAVVSSRSG